MKLTAVNDKQIRQNNNNIRRQNVNFKGVPEAMVGFWKFVDSSRGIQFTVEDMLGTNIPRTGSGALSGYKYTKKINWPYLWQEGIREFLTGPTMTCAPVAILALVTKLSGKTANTHIDNIVNLSNLANLAAEDIDNSAENFKSSFIQKAIKDTVKQTTGVDDIDIVSLTDLVKDYGNAKDKKTAKNILSDAQKEFEKIVKRYKADYNGVDFSVAKYSKAGDKIGAIGFDNYVKYINAFAEDYAKANKGADGVINLAKENIDKFRDSWCLKRLGVVTAMIFLTGYIMSFIPKLYTLASGGINPAGKAIYDEAAKREGK